MITYFNPLYDNYEGYDHAVKVEHNYNVLTKQVEDLTAENESEFGNDPVWVNKGYDVDRRGILECHFPSEFTG